MSDEIRNFELNMTRRQLFGKAAFGLGSMALGSLLSQDLMAGGVGVAKGSGKNVMEELMSGTPHFAPKAKRVIYLFMSGAPSQLDMWDYKPKLREYYNKDLPESIRRGQRITTMTSGQTRFPVAPSVYNFKKYKNNQDGVWVSELLPHTAGVVKELCVVKGMYTEAINHDPAITFIQTGSQLPGRPSMGAWVSYGLGSLNADLPGYMVLHSSWTGRRNAQALYSRLWGTGFLPSEHQGVSLRSQGDAVLYLSNPKGVNRKDRRRMLDALGKLNHEQEDHFGDPEIAARIKQYEMAYRMQASVPELTDLSDEDEKTYEMYGPDSRKKGTFAANCLLARRLAEKGVRFTQIFHRGWDNHERIPTNLPKNCKDIDQPCAALIKDLKRRGMLEDTLVVWGGEFGRTTYCQGTLSKETYGRDHHPRCYTMWMAGGGIKPGITYGQTDDYGYNIVDASGRVLDPKPEKFTKGAMHIHDLNATMLHLMGINHKKLTYRYQGRDFRITDLDGHVVKDILA